MNEICSKKINDNKKTMKQVSMEKESIKHSNKLSQKHEKNTYNLWLACGSFWAITDKVCMNKYEKWMKYVVKRSMIIKKNNETGKYGKNKYKKQ